MSQTEACCTCATLLTDTKVPYDTESEKPIVLDRRLDCCGRTICATCQYHNSRFQTYCPFCQISTEAGAIPSTGLRLPPSYTDANGVRSPTTSLDLPPAYDSLHLRGSTAGSANLNPPPDTRDVVHFLTNGDSINSLSLAYKVPAPILRQHNNIFQDSLLAGRKFVLIPHTHYTGPALSTPPDPEEEERKNKVRRWMVATKCPEYSVALLYLKGSEYNLDIAVESYKADEQWEREHPMDKGKGRNTGRSERRAGGSLAGQMF